MKHIKKFNEDVELSNEKEFMVKDKTGRGFVSTLDESDLLERWDLEEQDDYDVTLGEFIDEAEIGDEWETRDTKITRTK